MRFTFSLLALASMVYGSALPRDTPSGVIAVDFTREGTNVIDPTVLTKRAAGEVTLPLVNQVASYIASVSLGTPGHTSKASLDTGSSDLWVYSSAVKATGYDSSKSSTYKLVSKDTFHITYVKGEATGDWVTDTASLGGATIKNFQFGEVTTANDLGSDDTGVFGIARAQDEAAPNKYDNFPVQLKKNGYIAQNAYSLYLNDITAQTGSVLFGGVDTAKYQGSLKKLAFTDSNSFEVEYSAQGYTERGILDSGTSLAYLPLFQWFAVIREIASWPNVHTNAQGWAYVNSAADIPKGKSLTFTFSGKDIVIPSEGIFDAEADNGEAIFAGFLPNTEAKGYTLLGDSILRYAYVVYHLDGNSAAIAQAKFTTASNIIPITGSSIPGAQ